METVWEIDSTNAELMRRAAKGDCSEVCLVAKRQRAGRARLGRRWLSDEDALNFSIGMVLAPPSWLGLSLVVGLVLAQQLHPNIQIKWPNDLLLDARKLAGILVETTAVEHGQRQKARGADQRYVVIGVGLNVRTPTSQEAFARPAVGLCECMPDATAAQCLGQALPAIEKAVRAFEHEGYRPFQAAFDHCDALWGQVVRLSNQVEGIARGTDIDGALLVQTGRGMVRVVSDEVSTRPVVGLR